MCACVRACVRVYVCACVCVTTTGNNRKDLTRFNKNAIRATAHMAADMEGVGLSRVHCVNLSVSWPFDIIVNPYLKHINTTRMHTTS